MNIVICFEDEMDEETLELLYEDLEETGFQLVMEFDDGAKIVANVPDEVPDPDYPGTVEDYWEAVINESMFPCCDGGKTETDCGVYCVKTLKQFREDDQKLNPTLEGGGYGDILSDIED